MPFESRVRLPHTDLEVSPIGLGSSFGVAASDLEYAFDHGINYFYWGSIRRPGFAAGLRRLAKGKRDEIVVVLQSYARWPGALLRANVESGLWRLGLDDADVLVLGWHNSRPSQAVLDTALELRESGRVRHLMMSGHQRSFFPEMAKEDLFDAFMVRYNAAHRGAEHDVFPHLPGHDERPGIVAYTATRWGSLLDPRKTPDGDRTPTAGDCYRFCLSHPDVDMTLCGPEDLAQVKHACEALEKGPLSHEELAWMRRVGDAVYGRTPFREIVD